MNWSHFHFIENCKFPEFMLQAPLEPMTDWCGKEEQDKLWGAVHVSEPPGVKINGDFTWNFTPVLLLALLYPVFLTFFLVSSGTLSLVNYLHLNSYLRVCILENPI